MLSLRIDIMVFLCDKRAYNAAECLANGHRATTKKTPVDLFDSGYHVRYFIS